MLFCKTSTSLMKEIKAYLHSINFQDLPLEDIIKVLKENHLFDSKIHSFTSLRRILNEVQKEKRTINNNMNDDGDAVPTPDPFGLGHFCLGGMVKTSKPHDPLDKA